MKKANTNPVTDMTLPVKTKFKNMPINLQINVGDRYLCPFTQIEKIWLGDSVGGIQVSFDLDSSEPYKKCFIKLLKLPQYKDKYKRASEVLLSI